MVSKKAVVESLEAPKKRALQPLPARPDDPWNRPTRQVYLALVDVFRRLPATATPDFARAARLADTDKKTAKTAFYRGWRSPDVEPGEDVFVMTSIRALLERERFKQKAATATVHAKLLHLHTRQAEQATEDFAIARAIEGDTVRKGMMTAQTAMGQMGSIFQSLDDLVNSINDDLIGMAQDPKVQTSRKIATVRQAVEVLEKLSSATDRFHKLERLYQGETKPEKKKPLTEQDVLATLAAIAGQVRAYTHPKVTELPSLPVTVVDVTPVEKEWEEDPDLLS